MRKNHATVTGDTNQTCGYWEWQLREEDHIRREDPEEWARIQQARRESDR